METPARAAERLMLGLGLALLMATGFALVDGRLPPADCPEEALQCTASGPEGWVLVGLTVIFLGSSLLMRLARTQGTPSPFSAIFGDVDEGRLEAKIEAEMSLESEAADEDARLNARWATLEAKVLSANVGEE